MQADLDKLIQVNQSLRRAQNKAHKDLSFVQGNLAQYQEGFRQLEAQKHHLQQAILTMTAVGASTLGIPALDTFASHLLSCIQQATFVNGSLPSKPGALRWCIKMVPFQELA